MALHLPIILRSSRGARTVFQQRPMMISSSSSLPWVCQSLQRYFTAPPSSPPKSLETDNEGDPKEPINNNNNSKKGPLPPSASPSSVLPGLSLSAATAVAGFSTASVLSTALAVPISGIPVSILFGMSIKNSGMGRRFLHPNYTYNDETMTFFQPGITMATKIVLQTGIVCVAAKLSFGQVLATGWNSIPVVVSAVGAGLVVLPMAGHWAGLPRQMTLLLTAGTTICGVTAITALAPAIQAPPRDIAVAVGNTVLFGTVGMLAYPYLLHGMFGSDGSSHQVGVMLGVAIHDTSQVLGAALSYKETFGNDEVTFQVAAVTKLIRNLGLAVAIPYLSYSHHAVSQEDSSSKVDGEDSKETTNEGPQKQQQQEAETMSGLATFTKKYVPPFLFAFLGMSALRSTGDLVLAAETAAKVDYFEPTMNFIGNDLSKYFLGTAMAGVGLSTSVDSLRGVGWKPFAVGGAGALVVGGTGLVVATTMIS